jgi:hypothetical protein
MDKRKNPFPDKGELKRQNVDECADYITFGQEHWEGDESHKVKNAEFTRVPDAPWSLPTLAISNESEASVIQWNVECNGPAIINIGKELFIIAENGSQSYDHTTGMFVIQLMDAHKIALSKDQLQRREQREALKVSMAPIPPFLELEGSNTTLGKWARGARIGGSPKLPKHIEKEVLDAAIANDRREFDRILGKYARNMKPFPPLYLMLSALLPNGWKECTWDETTQTVRVPFDTACTVQLLVKAISNRSVLIERGFVLVTDVGDWKLPSYALREIVVQAYCLQFKGAFDQLQAMDVGELVKRGLCPGDVLRIANAREETRLAVLAETMETLDNLPKCYGCVSMKDPIRRDLARSLAVANMRLTMELARTLVANGATSKAHVNLRAKKLMGTYKFWMKKEGLKDRRCVNAHEGHDGAKCPYNDMKLCAKDMGLEDVPTEDPYDCTPAAMMRGLSIV